MCICRIVLACTYPTETSVGQPKHQSMYCLMYGPIYRPILDTIYWYIDWYYQPILDTVDWCIDQSIGRYIDQYSSIYLPVACQLSIDRWKVSVKHRWNMGEISVKYGSSMGRVWVKYRYSIGEPQSILTHRIIGRYSTDISTYTRSSINRYSVEYWPMYWLIYRPKYQSIYRRRVPRHRNFPWSKK